MPVAVPPPAAAAEPIEPKRASQPQLRTVPVKPVPVTSGRIGDSQVDLMNSGRLSAIPVFGTARPKVDRPAAADAFDARFGGNAK